jgi:geranylgeranylglycerol-phosphate geranylgeranyltransferase
MRWLLAVLKLLRADGTAAACLAIFLPSYLRTADVVLSTERALPILFIVGCTYIANDLDDIDKDRINHPRRPLASGRLTPTFAATLFFTFLAGALFSTRYFIPDPVAFVYYSLLVVSVSYGYLVEWLPSFKVIYVAIAETFPPLILLQYFPGDTRLRAVSAAIFFHALGREVCKDIQDRPGDVKSFVHKLNPNGLSMFAFLLQGIAIAALAIRSRTGIDVLVLLTMTGVVGSAALTWFAYSARTPALLLLKLEIVIGLYFLL